MKRAENIPDWLDGGSVEQRLLWEDRDHYPAHVLDDTTCDHNGLCGNCGLTCKAYLIGNCPDPEEVEKNSKEAIDD